MSAPLIPDITVNKEDNAPSRFQQEHEERVSKAKAVDAIVDDINRQPAKPVPQSVTRSSSGIQAILLVADNGPAQKVNAKKSALADLHPKVKPVAEKLTPNAAQLLSLVVKADEVYRGGQLIDLSSFAIKSALDISEPEAVAARSELEARRLIAFHDNGAGIRGFYPRLP